MPRCYLIPGYLSTNLSYDAAGTIPMWPDRSQLIQGAEGAMRLAPNGIDPGPPDGVQLFATGPLQDPWDTAGKLLRAQLQPHGYRTVVWIWDWRKDITASGAALADRIRERVTADDPCTLAAHSTGGLLALAAWISLVSTNQQDLVRRIVGMGVPFQGTYYPQAFLAGTDPGVEFMLYVNNVLGGGIYSPFVPPTVITWTNLTLGKLALTWPSFYELFPSLAGTWSTTDPNRPKLFEAANWPAALGISQTWLDYAVNTFWPPMQSTANLPPFWILTTYAGTGTPTFNTLSGGADLTSAANYGTTEAGDGVVTVTSATVDSATQNVITCAHSSIPLTLAQSGELAAEILTVRTPVTPPPPPDVDPTPLPVLISDPPQSVYLGGTVTVLPCTGSKCQC